VAEGLLGASHPLAVLLHMWETAIEQVLGVAAVQAAGVGLMCGGAPFGLSLALAAAVVQIALGCRLALLVTARRDLCLELIIEGRAGLPLAAVEHEWRRLDPRRRACLARSIEEVAGLADRRRTRPAQRRPLFVGRVVRQVAPQLRETARLLRADDAAAPGVALVERLVTSGTSPLYGSEVEPLRRELGRARYLLTQLSGRGSAP
jgi:hypothetical protein